MAARRYTLQAFYKSRNLGTYEVYAYSYDTAAVMVRIEAMAHHNKTRPASEHELVDNNVIRVFSAGNGNRG